MTDRQQTIESALQRAQNTPKRLTVAQGKLLARYAQDTQNTVTSLYNLISGYRQTLSHVQGQLEHEREFCGEHIRQTNHLQHVLCELLHIDVISKNTEFWDVVEPETRKVILAGYKTVPEAFEAALRMRLGKEESKEPS